jgi:hypothetical protein
MTAELRRLKLALLIFAGIWLLTGVQAQLTLYKYGRQIETLQSRLQQVDTKIESLTK